MASEQQVKQYLAYWFQLGKKVWINNGSSYLLPNPVIQGNRYSSEFEQCWQQILSPESGECYLEGTKETIAELLTPAWDMMPCSRCEMPIPVRRAGMPPLFCPCHDLLTWPNSDVPAPRSPVNTQNRLQDIRDRLFKANTPESGNDGEDEEQRGWTREEINPLPPCCTNGRELPTIPRPIDTP